MPRIEVSPNINFGKGQQNPKIIPYLFLIYKDSKSAFTEIRKCYFKMTLKVIISRQKLLSSTYNP